jgi:diguanylate cyclase (GGDEF)-like protein
MTENHTPSGRLAPAAPSETRSPPRWDILAVCAGLAVLILALDLAAPLGIACGLYVTVLMFSLLGDRPVLTWRMAVVLTLFVMVGMVQEVYHRTPVWPAVANRAVATFVLWMTAAMGVRLQRMKRQVVDHGRQLEILNAELMRIARYDGLTSIANRRYFDEVLHQEFLRASRDRVPLALLMIDVDYFKSFNDAHGHLAGDNCLVRIAQAIQACVRRPADLVARFGGEEFAAILPGTTLQGAIERGEAIRQRIEAMDIETDILGQSARVTVSVGVSLIHPKDQGTSVKQLLDSADRALYEGKGSGRNSVRVAA